MKNTLKLLPGALIVFALAFMSCENEEVDVNSLELEQSLKLEENKQHDQENFNSITYKNNTYSISEVYDNEELFNIFKNAQITYVEDNTSDESLKPNIFIYDSEEEFNTDKPKIENDKSRVNPYSLLSRVTFYENIDFKGRKLSYRHGMRVNEVYRRNLISYWHDLTSSFEFENDPRGELNLVLRQHEQQRGRSVRYRSRFRNLVRKADLRSANFNDILSSFQIYRKR